MWITGIMMSLVKMRREFMEDIYLRLEKLRHDTTLVDAAPEWYNPHDYGSGYFKARQNAVKDEIEFLETLLDKIER